MSPKLCSGIFEMIIEEKRPRIAYLVDSNALSGGLRVIFQQAEELAKRGYQVSLVCPDPKPKWCSFHSVPWEEASFQLSEALRNSDIRIATFWTTVSSAIENYRGLVLHLCQGYEGDFSFYGSIRNEIESAYAKPTHKLAVSPHIASRLQILGYEPVTYIGQTFDSQAFPVSKKRRFDRPVPRILLVGIFEADVKGIQETLMALDKVKKAGIKFHLTRVSPQPQSQKERELFEADDYHVHVSTEEMARLYRQADLLVGPSHSEEGFGLPVLESMSCGLPALLSDTPSHKHIARSAAVYFRCEDISSLADGISMLLTSEEKRRVLSNLGPLEARRFRTSTVVDRLIYVFGKYQKRVYV